MRKYIIALVTASIILSFSCSNGQKDKNSSNIGKNVPAIVNIINFVRLLEPRIPEFTEDVLYQTVVQQVKIMRQYKLRGTFLLQYDALMDPRYQELMKSLPRDTFEIGAWWEIPQPLVENAGMKWRGRYPWDWHANVGFTTGYTPAEREKLADVYMSDFKKIFGYYPESVGCWFIDAHTLDYLYDKYKISSSCMCRDQVGTDGYTLWGGYWNQAYYPSRINSYMPAQTEEKQLPLPVFRMLGSDPVRQYEKGVPPGPQDVITLEPVYAGGGGDSTWVHWFFNELVNSESLEFNYVQAGQENSFTWNRMAKGYKLQMPLIAGLRDENRLVVQTLGESGKWFSEKYKITPATSFTTSNEFAGDTRKTAWFNSRFYRTNLVWENGNLRIRDIHLFDENMPSSYTTERSDSTSCKFFTLPFVDGYLWSTKDFTSGMRFKAFADGKEVPITGGDQQFSKTGEGMLQVDWPLSNVKGTLIISMDEKGMMMEIEGNGNMEWYLELTAAPGADLPFTETGTSEIDCRFEGINYNVEVQNGKVERSAECVFRINSVDNKISLDFSGR